MTDSPIEESGSTELVIPQIEAAHIAVLPKERYTGPLFAEVKRLREEFNRQLAEQVRARARRERRGIVRRHEVDVLRFADFPCDEFDHAKKELELEVFPEYIRRLGEYVLDLMLSARVLMQNLYEFSRYFFVSPLAVTDSEVHRVEVIPVTEEYHGIFSSGETTKPFRRTLDETTHGETVEARPIPIGMGGDFCSFNESHLKSLRAEAADLGRRARRLHEALSNHYSDDVPEELARRVDYLNVCLRRLLQDEVCPETGLFAMQANTALRDILPRIESAYESIDALYPLTNIVLADLARYYAGFYGVAKGITNPRYVRFEKVIE